MNDQLMNFSICILVTICLTTSTNAQRLESRFRTPPPESHPETWFHLISGNVSKPALTTDLEAIAGARLQGIQLFHGAGRPWPGVTPQIQTLSPTWDSMISHVADETQRLGLRFTMQNCPGWAMSGGPWITPDKAMRHLVWSRQAVIGGKPVLIDLQKPQPSDEVWRDYREVAVLAFPTPLGDNGTFLQPVSVNSNDPKLAWSDLLKGKQDTSILITPAAQPTWLELSFTEPTTLRSIELPPVELLMKRRNFDPDARIRLEAMVGDQWKQVTTRSVPRGNWQDKLPEYPLVLAFPDFQSRQFRISFESKHPMELSYLRFSSAARVNDWRGQAGYALRSLDRDPNPVQDPLSCLKSESIIDLTVLVTADGRLEWDAPAGDWTVLRFGHVNTGVKNKPAPPEATGFECDKLSPAGAEQHFAGYIGRLSAPGGPADKGRLQGMLIDSWECFTQTWTPAMEREFTDRRGYQLRPWLPAIAGYVIDNHVASERFLRDWRKTISDMLVQNYFGRLADLARQRGMKLSFETAIGDVSPGDILEYFKSADIPMCEFWQPNDPHWGGFEAKPIHPTVSAAHIYGKPIVAAEAFTNTGHHWNDHPFTLKHLADQHFTLGVNHLVFHTYTHNPLERVPGTSFGGGIGTPFIRGQTWWKHMPLFTDYLARCQFLLQQGQPVTDVLWYLGDDLNHKPMQSRPFPDGYSFDYLNQDALLHRVEFVNGQLRNAEGVSWKILWLPNKDCQRLTPQTLSRLKELLEAGATIVGRAPRQNPSLSGGAEADETFISLVEQLWGENPPAHGDRKIGNGRLIWGDNLGDTLASLGVAPDVTGTRASTWCHRHTDDTEIYFVAADRKASLEANLRFRAKGQPEFWNPLTGTTSVVSNFHADGQHTVVPISLPAAGSVFVVFKSVQQGSGFTKVERHGTPLIDATDVMHVEQTESDSVFGLTRNEPLQLWLETPFRGIELPDNGTQLLAFEDGRYRVTKADGSTATVNVEGCQTISVAAPWVLSFPQGWETPAHLELPSLIPWSAVDDPPTRSFSGTATYATTIQIDELANDSRFLIDLGRVADIAEVRINDQPVATLWAPPFRADITQQMKVGSNVIEIKVTNTWHNRLAYDASLKPDQRKTWTISGPATDDPLEPAGLFGPVLIRKGKITNIPAAVHKP